METAYIPGLMDRVDFSAPVWALWYTLCIYVDQQILYSHCIVYTYIEPFSKPNTTAS